MSEIVKSEALENFGFSFGKSGPHTARTIMFEDLEILLDHVKNESPTQDDFSSAILEDNCLSKKSGRTRELTFRHLKELYGLDSKIPLFRNLLMLWTKEEEARVQLSMLCAIARDRIFRNSYQWIEGFQQGENISRQHIEEQIEATFPDRYSPATLKSVAQNLNSSWTKVGHLEGRVKKIRSKCTPTASAVAYALYLSYLCGVRGASMFESLFCKALDAHPNELMDKAEVASRRGWIVLKRLGDVIEIHFPNFITDEERGLL